MSYQRDDLDIAPVVKEKKSNFIGSLGNFSIQYNMSVLSIAITILSPHLPEPEWAKNALLAMVFTGSVLGMFCMGYLGDLVGRRLGMIITLSFVVVGVIGSSLLSWGDDSSTYGVLAACRFIIGIGVGGIYPMAAATSAEGSSKDEDASERVGWAFFWQSPGAMAPYAVAWLLTLIPESYKNAYEIQFRLVLIAGAIPAAIVWLASFKSAKDVIQTNRKDNPAVKLALRDPEYIKALIGTGGSWFLYDIAYYGTSIFTPQILKGIFGDKDTLAELCWQSLAVSSFGIPAVISSVLLVKKLGGKWLNFLGFMFMALMFGAMAIVYIMSTNGLANAKFAIFCILTFSLNWGPNSGTYITPAMIYPPKVRTTFHGFSAASGKLGAVVGTIIFSVSPISEPAVFQVIMWLLVGFSLAGAIVSLAFIPDTRVPTTLNKFEDIDDNFDGDLEWDDNSSRADKIPLL